MGGPGVELGEVEKCTGSGVGLPPPLSPALPAGYQGWPRVPHLPASTRQHYGAGRPPNPGCSRARNARDGTPGASASSQPLIGPTWAEVLKLRRRAAPAGRARAESMAEADRERTSKRKSWRQRSDSNDLYSIQSLLTQLRLASREVLSFRSRPTTQISRYHGHLRLSRRKGESCSWPSSLRLGPRARRGDAVQVRG